jgi:hypothetical protein
MNDFDYRRKAYLSIGTSYVIKTPLDQYVRNYMVNFGNLKLD